MSDTTRSPDPAVVRHTYFTRRALRALTPQGTAGDFDHVANAALFSDDQLALFERLAREERPDIYLESSLHQTPRAPPAPWQPTPPPATEPTPVPLHDANWSDDALGARLLWILREEGRRRAPSARLDGLEPEPLEVPADFIDALDARRGAMPRRPRPPSADACVRWAVSGIYESMGQAHCAHVLAALLTLTKTPASPPRHYLPLVRHVRSAVVGGAGMMRPPEPIVLDEATLDELPGRLQSAPGALASDDLTMTCALLAALRRGGHVMLDDYLARYTHEPDSATVHLDPRALSDALTATFPMWEARLERKILPLDQDRIDVLISRCDHVGASHHELDRMRALAWRRLANLCMHPLDGEGSGWVELLTRGLEARHGVGDLTALVVGLDLYCAGFFAQGARIWRTRPLV